MTALKCYLSDRRPLCLLLLALCAWSSMARAGSEAMSGLQIHGFLSQGYVKTDANRFFGDSPNGSFEFTELGINASLRPTPSLLLSGQLLSRNAGDMYDADPQLDYALVDWTFLNADDLNLGIALGRQKNPIGLFNETRDVASTRPGIFVPQSIYYDKVRNQVLASDGVGLHLDKYTQQGIWQFDALYGYTLIDANVEYAYLLTDLPGEMTANDPSVFARIGYEDHAGRWKLAASGMYVSMDFEAQPGSPFSDGSTSLSYWILSAQYNSENWSLTGEYGLEPLTWRGYGPLFPDQELTAKGWYLQGDYHLRQDLSVMLRYESALSNKDDPDGSQTELETGGFLPAHTQYSKIWVAGLRWDITPQLMFRAEYQWHDGTFILSNRENPDPQAVQKDWQLFALLLSYRF